MDLLIEIITSFLCKAQKKEKCQSLYKQFSNWNVHSQVEKSNFSPGFAKIAAN